VQLVAAPDGDGDDGDEVEYVARDAGIARQAGRPAHRRAEIRDEPVPPAAHLVAKQAQPTRVPTADGARGDDTAALLVAVRRRRELDRVTLVAHVHDEHRVVEVAARPPLPGGLERLEDATVQAHAVSARAERDPVEVDGRRAGVVHRCSAASPDRRRPASG
jgi:hypothetical protein